MSKRDVVLSLCSLLLGVTLGASSIMYAQEVALSAPSVSDVRAGKFAAPAKWSQKWKKAWDNVSKPFSKRQVHNAPKTQLNRPNVSRPGAQQ